MRAKESVLPDELAVSSGAVNVVLFSRDGCPFCAIVRRHYLQPLAAERRPRIRVAEIEMDGQRTLLDWQGKPTTHAEFGRVCNVRFAPTVMFLGASGRELVTRIIGLSPDYFGAYLDAGIAAALAAGR